MDTRQLELELLYVWRLLWGLERVKPGYVSVLRRNVRVGRWHYAYRVLSDRIVALEGELCAARSVEVWKYEN